MKATTIYVSDQTKRRLDLLKEQWGTKTLDEVVRRALKPQLSEREYDAVLTEEEEALCEEARADHLAGRLKHLEDVIREFQKADGPNTNSTLEDSDGSS